MAIVARPEQQQWAEVVADDACEAVPAKTRIGQVRHIAPEVVHDLVDESAFSVDGKDKSWFLQKGAVSFERQSASRFQLEVQFLGGASSSFGDDYAVLSRAQQHATVNWMLMLGVARGDRELTGYQDCKTSGFYFLLHLNFRRTHWRVIGSPHNSELEDTQGKLYTCNPQDGGQFELPAGAGQRLGVELVDRELWLLDGGERVLRGHWACEEGASNDELSIGKLPEAEYYPAILLPNCPTALRAVVIA